MLERIRQFFRRKDLLLALWAGLLYGVVAQFMARKVEAALPVLVVMSFGYVFVLPLCIGWVTAAARTGKRTWQNALYLPLVSATLCLLVAFAVGWEGSICLLMAAPIYLPLAMLGGLLGHKTQARARTFDEHKSAWLVPALLLPFMTTAAEQGVAVRRELIEVHDSIDIEAAESVVFPLIARVRPITERQESLFYTMGFPRPIEATLSKEGVGGVRHASFERGLTFVETVTRWEPPREIRFSIVVDPAHTPLTTLDTHVTVGGDYFDVLEGGYRIEPLGPSRVRLHLDSRHRLSTHFNFYAGLWSRYLMSEVQHNILGVIKQRAERAKLVESQRSHTSPPRRDVTTRIMPPGLPQHGAQDYAPARDQ